MPKIAALFLSLALCLPNPAYDRCSAGARGEASSSCRSQALRPSGIDAHGDGTVRAGLEDTLRGRPPTDGFRSPFLSRALWTFIGLIHAGNPFAGPLLGQELSASSETKSATSTQEQASEVQKKVDELLSKREPVDMKKVLGDSRILLMGDSHSEVAIKDFIRVRLKTLKDLGVQYVAMEMLPADLQDNVDAWVREDQQKVRKHLEKFWDKGPGVVDAFMGLISEGKKLGMTVVGLQDPDYLESRGIDQIDPDLSAIKKDEAEIKAYFRLNTFWSNRIREYLRADQEAKMVVFAGSGHFSSSRDSVYGILRTREYSPSIADFTGYHSDEALGVSMRVTQLLKREIPVGEQITIESRRRGLGKEVFMVKTEDLPSREIPRTFWFIHLPPKLPEKHQAGLEGNLIVQSNVQFLREHKRLSSVLTELAGMRRGFSFHVDPDKVVWDPLLGVGEQERIVSLDEPVPANAEKFLLQIRGDGSLKIPGAGPILQETLRAYHAAVDLGTVRVAGEATVEVLNPFDFHAAPEVLRQIGRVLRERIGQGTKDWNSMAPNLAPFEMEPFVAAWWLTGETDVSQPILPGAKQVLRQLDRLVEALRQKGDALTQQELDNQGFLGLMSEEFVRRTFRILKPSISKEPSAAGLEGISLKKISDEGVLFDVYGAEGYPVVHKALKAFSPREAAARGVPQAVELAKKGLTVAQERLGGMALPTVGFENITLRVGDATHQSTLDFAQQAVPEELFLDHVIRSLVHTGDEQAVAEVNQIFSDLKTFHRALWDRGVVHLDTRLSNYVRDADGKIWVSDTRLIIAVPTRWDIHTYQATEFSNSFNRILEEEKKTQLFHGRNLAEEVFGGYDERTALADALDSRRDPETGFIQPVNSNVIQPMFENQAEKETFERKARKAFVEPDVSAAGLETAPDWFFDRTDGLQRVVNDVEEKIKSSEGTQPFRKLLSGSLQQHAAALSSYRSMTLLEAQIHDLLGFSPSSPILLPDQALRLSLLNEVLVALMTRSYAENQIWTAEEVLRELKDLVGLFGRAMDMERKAVKIHPVEQMPEGDVLKFIEKVKHLIEVHQTNFQAGLEAGVAARRLAAELWSAVWVTPIYKETLKPILPVFYDAKTFSAIPLVARGELPFLVIVSSLEEETQVRALLDDLQVSSDQYQIWRLDLAGIDLSTALARAWQTFLTQYSPYLVDSRRPEWFQELLLVLKEFGVIPLDDLAPAVQATEDYFFRFV